MSITTQDRLEIEDLAARYNLAIDLADPRAWVDCFIPDGELTIDKVGPWSSSVKGLKEGAWRGRAQLMTFATAVGSGSSMRHWSFNRVLTAAGDGIDAVSYMNVLYLDPAGAPDALLTGIMRDRLVHVEVPTPGAGSWGFASRCIAFDR